jgi:hypothetical protein
MCVFKSGLLDLGNCGCVLAMVLMVTVWRRSLKNTYHLHLTGRSVPSMLVTCSSVPSIKLSAVSTAFWSPP